MIVLSCLEKTLKRMTVGERKLGFDLHAFILRNPVKNFSPVNKQSKEIPVKLKGWKRWAFPLVAMIIVPALFFILLELGLKVANYGFPTSFFVKRKVAEKTVYTDNRQYGWRFFPAKVARRPADIVLPAEKSEKAF